MIAANVKPVVEVATVTPVVEEISSSSPLIRNRIIAFVNDDISAAALRTGMEGTNIEVNRGDIHNVIRFLERDTDVMAIVADISDMDDPIGALEAMARVCPSDVLVALIGDNVD